MKRFGMLLLCFMFVGCGFLAEDDVEEVQIQSVVEDVKSNLINFNTENVSDVGKIIRKNIDILDNLILKINETEEYEKVFPEIVNSVDGLSDNYNKLSNMKEDIRKTLNKRVDNIVKKQKLTTEKIEILTQNINITKTEIVNEKTDYRKKALKTKLKFQEQELEVWNKFSKGMKFNELISKLRDASGGINKFIDILDANAEVYEQASKTLHAIQSYKNAHKDLQEVLAVVELGNELIDSWDKLAIVIDGAMERIESVESIEF